MSGRRVGKLGCYGVFSIAALAVMLDFSSASSLLAKRLPGSPAAQLERTYRIKGEAALANVLRVDEVRNADTAEFPIDFQIKITNISDKPIYHINIVVLFPRTKELLGGRYLATRLVYGPSRMLNLRQRPMPEDVPLKPGESYVFKIDNVQARNIRTDMERKTGNLSILDEFDVDLHGVNFGDGSGYKSGVLIIDGKMVDEGSSDAGRFSGCPGDCGGYQEAENPGDCGYLGCCSVYGYDGGLRDVGE